MPFCLKSIEMFEVRMALRTPFRISSGVEHGRRVILLKLTDADGASCWSECVGMETPNYVPDTVDTSWVAIGQWLVPRVLGKSFETPAEVAEHLTQDIRGHTMAIAAVEMGCWGLAAEKAGISLAALVGGTRSSIDVGVSVGLQESIDELLRVVSDYRDEGYRRVKLKVKPGSDVELVAAVRELLGREMLLSVDANSAYSLDDMDRLQQMGAQDLLMIEQPFAWDDLADHSLAQAQLDTPICLDESIRCLRHAEQMVRLGSGRAINIKPGRVGGFAEAIAIHNFAVGQGLPVWCGGMLETGIGRAYNVALASLPGFVWPGDISPSRRYWPQDIVEPEWTMNEGQVRVPTDKTGLGVTVSEGAIREAASRSERFFLDHLVTIRKCRCLTR